VVCEAVGWLGGNRRRHLHKTKISGVNAMGGHRIAPDQALSRCKERRAAD